MIPTLAGCEICRGTGVWDCPTCKPSLLPCLCSLREVFKIVLTRYREILQCGPGSSCGAGTIGDARVYQRPYHDFKIDVELSIKRTLWPADERLFSAHFVAEIPLSALAPQFRTSTAELRRRADHVAEQMGLVWASLAPYPLYPSY